jgi:hypothetical protein
VGVRVTLVEEMVLELGCFGKCLCIYLFNYDTATSLLGRNWELAFSTYIILKNNNNNNNERRNE